MLKTMRHHAKYFYVLFFIVILSFIFWGVGTVDESSNAQIIAEVGNYSISTDEYGRAYDRAFRFYRDLYKEKFDEEMQNKLKLKETVLDSLVNNRILLITAKENRINISDQELRDAIMNEPVFMRSGVFDPEIYQNTLRLSRLTPEAYESMKREEITLKKMTRLIETAASSPDVELKNLNADDQTIKAIQNAMSDDAREKIIKAYIEGIKKKIKIKINKELL